MKRGKQFDKVDELISLYNQGKNPKEIAEKVDLSPNRVYYYLRTLGNEGRIDYGKMSEEKLKAIEFIVANYSTSNTDDIANKLNLPKWYVRRVANDRNITKKKITREYASEAKRLGKSVLDISNEFGYSMEYIRRRLNLLGYTKNDIDFSYTYKGCYNG